MKILENYIAPTEHSQGDVGDIWIDKSTGDVYKCTGLTGSVKDLGYIVIGADATNTKYMWEKAGGASGGGKTFDVAKITFASDCEKTCMYGTITDENGQVLNYILDPIVAGNVVYVPVGSPVAFENYDNGYGNGVMFSVFPDGGAYAVDTQSFVIESDSTFDFSVEPYL